MFGNKLFIYLISDRISYCIPPKMKILNIVILRGGGGGGLLQKH